MKIIKNGRQIIHTIRVSCQICNAELEITANDLKKELGGGVYSYECPCCHRNNYHTYYNLISKGVNFDDLHN